MDYLLYYELLLLKRYHLWSSDNNTTVLSTVAWVAMDTSQQATCHHNCMVKSSSKWPKANTGAMQLGTLT